jgi:hypothetical protein
MICDGPFERIHAATIMVSALMDDCLLVGALTRDENFEQVYASVQTYIQFWVDQDNWWRNNFHLGRFCGRSAIRCVRRYVRYINELYDHYSSLLWEYERAHPQPRHAFIYPQVVD